MYGHQIYRFSIETIVKYINNELESGFLLEDIAANIFIDIEDLREELRAAGYFYVYDLNQILRIEVLKAG